MPRKNGHSLLAVPNFIHKIREDRFYALYLERWGGGGGGGGRNCNGWP